MFLRALLQVRASVFMKCFKCNFSNVGIIEHISCTAVSSGSLLTRHIRPLEALLFQNSKWNCRSEPSLLDLLCSQCEC